MSRFAQAACLSAVVLFGLRTYAEQVEQPKELSAVEDSYKQAVQRAVEPLRVRYLADLGRLRESFTRAGKLHEALAVEEAIKAAGASSGDSPSSAEVKTVVIQANSEAGTTIGKGKSGQRVTVQYVNGQWKTAPSAQLESPDEAYGKNEKLTIVGTVDGNEDIIAVVPSGTKTQPFSATLSKDYDRVFLRISDGIRGDNSGKATYKASIR